MYREQLGELFFFFFFFFNFLNNFISKTITYTTYSINYTYIVLATYATDTYTYTNYQGCALAAPGRLRRLTFGLGRLKKKSGRPSGRIDFGLCENSKRNQQTYRNGTERNESKRNSIVLPGPR